jgi:PAS domain S-box-containing protein
MTNPVSVQKVPVKNRFITRSGLLIVLGSLPAGAMLVVLLLAPPAAFESARLPAVALAALSLAAALVMSARLRQAGRSGTINGVSRNSRQAVAWRLEQLALIERIVQQISSSQDFNEIIGKVLETAVRTTGADMAALALVTDEDDLWAIAYEEVDGRPVRSHFAQGRDEGVIGRVIQTGKMMLVADNSRIDYYRASPNQVYRSSLVVPLIKDGQTIGALNVESVRLNFFDEEQAVFLKSLGAHALISIHNARLLEELQYQINTLTSLRELSLRLSSTADTSSVAAAVVEAALDILRGHYAVLFHYDETTRKLARLTSRELAGPDEASGVVDTLRQAAYQAVETGEMQVVEDLKGQDGQRLSLMAAPVKRQGRAQEVLCMVAVGRRAFQERERGALALLAIQAAGHLENATLHERIRQGNDRMSAILDSTRDGVILIDDEGRLVEFNPSAERLLGIHLGEYVGESYVGVLLRQARQYDRPTGGYTQDELEAMAQSRWFALDHITRRQFKRQTAQNQELFIEETGSPVTGKDNRIVGRLLALRDITEAKQLDIYRDEITNMVVHDLRGPLASIINGVRLAKDNIPDIQKYPIALQTLSLATVNAERLLNLVSSLLDIAKLESRQLNLDYGIHAVGDLIRSAHQSLLPSIQMGNLQVELIIPPDLPAVRVDGEKIRRVLINLLDNALRYTPAGGQIQISAGVERGRLLVRVADSGPGIPEAERSHVFEKYHQVRGNYPARGIKGSGLGLTFCKLVLDAHGQEIWIEPDGPLPGACFAFTLPLV